MSLEIDFSARKPPAYKVVVASGARYEINKTFAITWGFATLSDIFN